jgi:hypothetical protein
MYIDQMLSINFKLVSTQCWQSTILFGIKYNFANGGPAQDKITEAIFASIRALLSIDSSHSISTGTECDGPGDAEYATGATTTVAPVWTT